MEIPGNELRIKNKIVQDQAKVKGPAKSPDSGSTSATSGTGSSEQIVLSSKAKDIQKAAEVVRSTPEIRVDKVERIKREIAEGRFHVDSKDIAEKLLKDIITESRFLG